MVDNLNPTSQFHPYQKPDATPNTERQSGGLGDMIRDRMGSLGGVNWKQPAGKVRDYARTNPNIALGALAALAIGVGLMRGRR